MDALRKDRLVAAGIDVDDALERFMGSEALFIRFLNKFLSDPNFEKLQAAIEGNRPEDALAAAHTLKGICGNLSMQVLFGLFTRQVSAMRAGDWALAAGMMDEIIPAYHKAVAAIGEGGAS